MRKNLLLTSIILMFTVVNLFAIPAIEGNYRWRNDDGVEDEATWKTSINDSIVQNNEQNIRLRIEFVAAMDFDTTMALLYQAIDDTVWHMVSDADTEAFMMASSAYFSNGESTTQQLPFYSATSFTPGLMLENPGPYYLIINSDESTEFEFCIKPTPNAEFNKSYRLRIDNSEFEEHPYTAHLDSLTPKIYLQKPTLTVTANNTSRLTGQSNPPFTVSYSGFVDGDDETVLNIPPKKVCGAGSSSPVGVYDIVPYGASDNKYEFAYVTGKLTVDAAPPHTNGIDDNYNETLVVYPNPASDFLYLKGNISPGSSARIYDMTGRLVLEQKLEMNEIDIQFLTNGLYLLTIEGAIYKINIE